MTTQSAAHMMLSMSSILALFLSGCGPRYTKSCLAQLVSTKECADSYQNGVSVHLDCLNESEAHVLFDHRGHRLYHGKNRCYALSCIIKNARAFPIYLTRDDVNIALINNKKIAAQLHTNTWGRAIGLTTSGFAAASLLFFGAAYITLCGAFAGMTGLVHLGYAALASSGVFFVGAPFWAATHAHHSYCANRQITNDINEKSFSERILINPGQSCQVLMFVRQKDYHDSIQFTFHEEISNVSIPVTVHEKENE